MGRLPQTISDILRGKYSITAETAIQLERVLGVSAEQLLRDQADYKLALLRRDPEMKKKLRSIKPFV